MVPIQRENVTARLIAELGLFISIFFLGVWFARHTLGTTFRVWDDEGYMLLSLRSYLQGHPLYSETYTQYGPFQFLAQAFSFWILHLPVTHDSGRLVTLVDWMLSAAIGAAFVYGISRNLLLAATATECCVVLAHVLANEPGHPQQIVLPLFMLSAALTAWVGSKSGNLVLFLLGAIGSALLLTKINLGIFYFVALAHTCVVLLPRSGIRTACLGILFAGATVLPYALMHANLTGVRGYCVAAALCVIATFGCGSLVESKSQLPWRGVVWAGIGSVMTAVVITIITLSQGVSGKSMLAGVLFEPIRHPHVFLIPLHFSKVAVARTVLAVGCTSMLAWLAIRGRPDAYRDWTGILQCIAGFIAVILIVTSHLTWAIPFLPMTLASTTRTGRRWQELLPRLFLADLAAMQFLGAYPVAGSQVAIAASPLLLCAFICIADGSEGPALKFRRLNEFGKYLILRSMTAALILFVAGTAWLNWFRPAYSGSSLIGAASLHLAPDIEARYQFLANNVRNNCDVLFTMPGMGSFNFWSGAPSPDASNATAWIQLLGSGQQHRILQILQNHSHACVIYNRDLVRFWQTPQASIVASPLSAYILNNMPTVIERDGYEIRVHPQRRRGWIQ
jgi:hypothetical protein